MATNNTVGHVVPTNEQTQQIDASLDTAKAGLDTFCRPVPENDRGDFLRPRSGAEKLMPLVFEIATEKKLSIDEMPLDGLDKDLQVAAAADRYEKKLEVMRQLAADTRLAAYGEAYQAFLGYYGILSSMAKHDATLAKRLQPVVDFMSTGPRTRKNKP